MEKFSVEEVQNWFETFQGGILKKYAAKFKGLNGYLMMELSKDDCKEIAEHVPNGIAIYNEWHKKVRGIFFPQLFADFFLSPIFLFLYEPFLLVQLSVFML